MRLPVDRPLVARFITRLNVGGPTRQVRLLHGGLPREGFGSIVVSGREGVREGRLALDDPRANVLPTLRRETRPLADARALLALTRFCRQHRPDLVHTHLAKAGALGRVAARRAGVPVIVHTFHGHVLEGYFSAPIARTFLEIERGLARRSTALVAVSDRVRDDLLALGIGDERKWHVIRVGLDIGPLLSGLPDAGSARLRLGLPLAVPTVGIVGRLVPIKDHETFLRAAVRVSRAVPDALFVVAGDGELRVGLERRAKELLGERIRFLGWVHDLPALYSALDAVVLTSRNEGTPVSLIEAGAAGRPVVATAVGGVPEVVEDGKTGWLVRPGAAEEVAARIEFLIGDPGAARALGQAARGVVAERYSARRMVKDHATLYRELLGRSR